LCKNLVLNLNPVPSTAFGTVHGSISPLDETCRTVTVLINACPQADGYVFAVWEEVVIHQSAQLFR
jgi:hypothetical protein